MKLNKFIKIGNQFVEDNNLLVNWKKTKKLDFINILALGESRIIREKFIEKFCNTKDLTGFYYTHFKNYINPKKEYLEDSKKISDKAIKYLNELKLKKRYKIYQMINETEDSIIFSFDFKNLKKVIDESYTQDEYYFDNTYSWFLIITHHNVLYFFNNNKL